MTILVNDESHSLRESASVQDLIETLDLVGKPGIAVAVNDDVVTRSVWADRHLNETDRVTIIQATQGG
jgi:sulfur carrier protein